MSRTIKKNELKKYLEIKITPLLGDEWQVYDGDTTIRVNDFLIQGVHLDTSSYSKVFVPWYFIQLIPIHSDHIYMTLGSRLKKKLTIRKHLMGYKPKEMWCDWAPEDDALLKEIAEVLHKQAKSSFDEPLTLETVVQYLESDREKLKSKNPLVRGSYGIVYGLLGHMKEAKKNLELAEKELERRALAWKKKGKNPPEHNREFKKEIIQFINKLTTPTEFCIYCKQQAEKTAQTLKLLT